jgi:hypothetical protein
MPQYSVPVILDIARVSGYLVANDVAKGALFGERVDPDWPLRLYLERKAVEWMHERDSDYDTLRASANYLFALCGGYASKALRVMARAGVVPGDGTAGDGAVIVGPAPGSYTMDFLYLVEVVGVDFADATNYNDTRIAGKELVVYWNEVNRYIEVGSEWAYTTGGIQILIEGFDATADHATATFKIYIKNPDVILTGDTTSSLGLLTEDGAAITTEDTTPIVTE